MAMMMMKNDNMIDDQKVKSSIKKVLYPEFGEKIRDFKKIKLGSFTGRVELHYNQGICSKAKVMHDV